jgi:hypothetical protein
MTGKLDSFDIYPAMWIKMAVLVELNFIRTEKGEVVNNDRHLPCSHAKEKMLL